MITRGDGLIEVIYEDDDGVVCYSGTEAGAGHCKLKAPGKGGQASLHRFDGGKVLDGYWREGKMRGMRRITLDR